MAAGTVPIFVQSRGIVGMARATAANTNRDGTGTVYTLVTGGTNATRVDRVTVTALVTTTAGMWRFYIFDGTNYRLIKEAAVSAVTPSGTVAAFAYEWVRPTTDTPPMALLDVPSGSFLVVSTNNAEAADFVAYGGAY